MPRVLITTLLLFLGSSVFSQVNYVRNPDFEVYTKCPGSADQIAVASGWSSIDTIGVEICTPDYLNRCSPANSVIAVPQNILGYQFPRSGNGMASVYMYTDMDSPGTYHMRDYLQGRLTRNLILGKTYCVTFFVNLAESSDFSIKEVSAYLDNGGIDTARLCGVSQTHIIPQVTNQFGVISDTMNWTKIEGTFIAQGNERFITIGNYRGKGQTTLAFIPPNNRNGFRTTYYFVDDVSVVESDLKADAGSDTHVGAGGSVYIGRPMESGPECSWSVLGSSAVIGTGVGIWVAPMVTTSYVVTQTVCGFVTKDTVRVEVWKAGVTTINGRMQRYSLSPNPNNGEIQLQQLEDDKRPVTIKVFNTTGSLAYSANKTFERKSVAISLPQVSSGLYHVMLRDSEGTVYTLRFIKK